MSNKNESGFSLIELLLVVVIIGIIAAVAVPSLQRSIMAAENGSAFSAMRTISSMQVSFYTQNNRFGHLTEINTMMNNGLGTVVPPKLFRGKYVFELAPLVPTDEQLRTGEFNTLAQRSDHSGVIYRYEMDQTGVITQVYP